MFLKLTSDCDGSKFLVNMDNVTEVNGSCINMVNQYTIHVKETQDEIESMIKTHLTRTLNVEANVNNHH